MQVRSVSIDGVPASFRFAHPAYPDDPKGPDDLRSPRVRGLGEQALPEIGAL